MKKKLLLPLILALSCLLFACAPRTLPPEEQSSPSYQEGTPTEEEEEDVPLPTDKPMEETEDMEDTESEEKDEEDEPSSNSPQSGTFLLMDSGYEICLKDPLQGIYNPGDGGFYISAKDDTSFQGIVAYLTGEELIASTEADIANIDEALANDPSVFNFQYDRQKLPDGTYYITFTYTNAKDAENASGFSYVHYQKTPNGILSVMVTCPRNDYSSSISAMFQSVAPATENALEAPSR